jgi:peroxiredoxin/uncharacterized membrane protein YphA (DoxX/SURF4 family)
VPGGIFPDYELPDHTGKLRKLSELQGDDPLILTLARGHYCPKEHQQHLELAAFYPKIAVAYTQAATISTDDHHSLQEFRASIGGQWTFLSDPDRTVQKDLDIQEYTDPEHDPMIPHTLVLKPGLVIYSIYNGYWFWGRPSVIDLWHDLRTVTSEIRPDWDLSAPGLREAWNAGDLSRFHGWGQACRCGNAPECTEEIAAVNREVATQSQEIFVMFPQLVRFTDLSLLLLRLMVGLVFVTSGYSHLKDPEARSKSIEMPKGFTVFLGIAEVAGAFGVAFGVLTQLAAFGLIALMLGAIGKKLFSWHTGFWGENLRLALRTDFHPDESGDRLHGRRTVCAALASWCSA